MVFAEAAVHPITRDFPQCILQGSVMQTIEARAIEEEA